MPFQKGNKLYQLRKTTGWETKISENHPNWKGENVGYKSLHEWVRKYLPKPKHCVRCNIREPKHVSNNDNKYTRNLEDWEWLCVTCHRLKDYARLRKERGYQCP